MDKDKDQEKTNESHPAKPRRNTPELFSEPRNGAAYVPRSGHYGITSVRVLPELTGKRWGDATLSYVTGLHPTEIRVCEKKLC